jgi:methionine-S-sulfoxide reductase
MLKFIYLQFLLVALGVYSMHADEKYEKATFAGGCFWCLEPPFEALDGVADVVAGYTGGDLENPTYEEVCGGTTNHYEAVEVTFDPSRVSYETLLDTFWRQIDPTDPEGQFADRGSQYRTAIFYHSEEQKNTAVVSKQKLEESGLFDKPVVTDIIPATTFYKAEDYHQDYYKTCPIRYKMYRNGSGREQYIEGTWGTKKAE